MGGNKLTKDFFYGMYFLFIQTFQIRIDCVDCDGKSNPKNSSRHACLRPVRASEGVGCCNRRGQGTGVGINWDWDYGPDALDCNTRNNNSKMCQSPIHDPAAQLACQHRWDRPDTIDGSMQETYRCWRFCRARFFTFGSRLCSRHFSVGRSIQRIESKVLSVSARCSVSSPEESIVFCVSKILGFFFFFFFCRKRIPFPISRVLRSFFLLSVH
jgi:hypothetical protein